MMELLRDSVTVNREDMQGLFTSQTALPHTTCSQHNNMILPSI
jgi:hypothetical protein